MPVAVVPLPFVLVFVLSKLETFVPVVPMVPVVPVVPVLPVDPVEPDEPELPLVVCGCVV